MYRSSTIVGLYAPKPPAFIRLSSRRAELERYRISSDAPGVRARLQEDSQRLSHVFELRGPGALANFIDERVSMQIAGERMLLVWVRAAAGARRQPAGLAAQHPHPGRQLYSSRHAGRRAEDRRDGPDRVALAATACS